MPKKFVRRSHLEITAAADALLKSAEKLSETALKMARENMPSLMLEWTASDQKSLSWVYKLGET